MNTELEDHRDKERLEEMQDFLYNCGHIRKVLEQLSTTEKEEGKQTYAFFNILCYCKIVYRQFLANLKLPEITYSFYIRHAYMFFK